MILCSKNEWFLKWSFSTPVPILKKATLKLFCTEAKTVEWGTILVEVNFYHSLSPVVVLSIFRCQIQHSNPSIFGMKWPGP
jgi:hypothetical protein